MAKSGDRLRPGNLAEERPKKVPRAPLTTTATKVSRSELFAGLSGLASGWGQDAERALSPPAELFFSRNDASGSLLFSSDPDFPISSAISLLSAGGRKQPAGFAIAVFETAGSSYFLLSDSSRRILVRGVLSSYHDKPPLKEWGAIVESIRGAEDAAIRNPGKTAVMDGNALRLV